MEIIDRIIITVAKFIAYFSLKTNLGAGATWPGEFTLTVRPHIAGVLAKGFKKGIILIAGTNGKTTTSLMIKEILEADGSRVIHNDSGANLLNGIVSALIKSSDNKGTIKADYGIFEVDENSLPVVLREIVPQAIILLNLFRDQLDRYGEVDVIAEKWQKAFTDPKFSKVKYFLNADDPLIAHLGFSLKKVTYFGVNNARLYQANPDHATDSTFCMACGARLNYKGTYFSHLGNWYCLNCGEKRPAFRYLKITSPLIGLYNQYNLQAAATLAKALGVNLPVVSRSLSGFKPAFGRQEEIMQDGKIIKIFLSKNPTGLNASLKTVIPLKPKVILFVLNDRIPDGRDISWIWDVDFENLEGIKVYASGDRVYDLALRLKYAGLTGNLTVIPDLDVAIQTALTEVKVNETLYVLPTYSAMLEIRKILSGRKIL